jgi:Arc/MetJ-type ribon-helix-helix transcriptional regulator
MVREGTVRTHVVLPAELVRQIDQLVGKRKRSAFIEDAVEERVKRERLRRALEATAGALKGKLPPEWEGPGGAAEWVHRNRQQDRRNPIRTVEYGDLRTGHDRPH